MSAPRLFLTCCLLGLATPVHVLGAEQAPMIDFEQTLDEAVAYHKRGHFKKAQVKLDLAARHSSAKTDFRFALFMARNCYRQLRLHDAFSWAEKAKRRATDDEILSTRVDELLLEMSDRYGPTRFVVAEGESNRRGRIFLDAKTSIINKEKRQVFESIRNHYRSTDVQLPTKIYLPYGEYTANSAPFRVALDQQVPTGPIFLQVERENAEQGLNKTALYIGVGSVLALATGIGAYFLLAGDNQSETNDPAHPIIIQNLRAR